jgi:hypothetical protein
VIVGIFCIALGLYLIYEGIKVIRTRLTYWVRPTIGRYKDRNIEKSSKLFANIIGIGNILSGTALIYIGIRVLLA